MLGSTPLGAHYKFYVTSENQTAVVFFSNEIKDLLTEATNIQFDGIFILFPFYSISYGNIRICWKAHYFYHALLNDGQNTRAI